MCLGWPFLPWQKVQAEHLPCCSAQSDDICSDTQVHAQTYPPKKDHDIIWASYGDVMMLGIWNDDMYISLEGYKRTNTRWGWGLQVRYQREQIYSPPVLRFVPAPDLPGIHSNGEIMCLVAASWW